MAGWDDNGKLLISANSLKNTAECSTRIWLIVNGYTTVSEAAELLAGSAVHTGMEIYFKTGSKLEALRAFSAEYAAWSAKHLQWFERLRHENVHKILAQWYDQHPLSKTPYRPDKRLIEQEIKVNLTQDGEIILVMRPDLVGYVGHSSGVCIVDHKSSKTINTYFKDKFLLDAQISTYWWGIEKFLDQPVTVFYINAIGLPQLSTSSKRCKEHGTAYSKCSVQHAKSHVFSYSRTPALLKEWHKNAVDMGRRLQHILTIAPDISHLHKVRMNGMMRGACTYCFAKGFCYAGRPINQIHEYLTNDTPDEVRKAA